MSEPSPSCIICEKSDQVIVYSRATDIEYFTTAEDYQFYECTRCQSLQIYPIPANKLSLIYPSNYYSFVASKKSVVTRIKEWLDRSFFRRLLKGIKKQELNILDVGGGTGWLIDLIKQADNRIRFSQVVDIDPKAAELARANGHSYFCGTIESFTSELKFDVVLLLNLIEHVENPLAVLESIKKLLAPEGIVIIKTPNYKSWDAKLFRNSNWGGYHCPRHWHLFARSSFEKLTKRAGFTISHFNYTQGAPFWAISIMGWLRSRNLVNINSHRPAIYHPLYTVLIAFFAAFDMIRGIFVKTSQMFIVLLRK